jgi:hypothetical protein
MGMIGIEIHGGADAVGDERVVAPASDPQARLPHSSGNARRARVPYRTTPRATATIAVTATW